jgi:hypothetical protein
VVLLVLVELIKLLLEASETGESLNEFAVQLVSVAGFNAILS